MTIIEASIRRAGFFTAGSIFCEIAPSLPEHLIGLSFGMSFLPGMYVQKV